MHCKILILFTLIFSVFTLSSEHPSHSQEQGDPDKSIIHREKPSFHVNDPDLELELVATGLEFPANMA